MSAPPRRCTVGAPPFLPSGTPTRRHRGTGHLDTYCTGGAPFRVYDRRHRDVDSCPVGPCTTSSPVPHGVGTSLRTSLLRKWIMIQQFGHKSSLFPFLDFFHIILSTCPFTTFGAAPPSNAKCRVDPPARASGFLPGTGRVRSRRGSNGSTLSKSSAFSATSFVGIPTRLLISSISALRLATEEAYTPSTARRQVLAEKLRAPVTRPTFVRQRTHVCSDTPHPDRSDRYGSETCV